MKQNTEMYTVAQNGLSSELMVHKADTRLKNVKEIKCECLE